MKILLLAYSYGGTASGRITQRIVEELIKQRHDVRLVVAESFITQENHNVIVLNSVLAKFPQLSYLWVKILTFFGFSAYNSHYFWRYRAKKTVFKMLKSWTPDYMFCRSTPIDPCIVGTAIHLRTGIPVYQHFSDPIPAPSTPDNPVRKRFIRQSEYIIRNSNIVSFGTKQMCDYIQSLIKYDFSHKCHEVPDVTLSSNNAQYETSNVSKPIKLVYLGTIYGARNPYPLFNAIKLLAEKEISCELLIYSNPPVNAQVSKQIKYMGYTRDVEQALSNADILVDLDGDDEIPVFISSKLKDYIITYKPILLITPSGSPSRSLLDGQKTVAISLNNENNIVNSIEYILSCSYKKQDYVKRHHLAKQFLPEVVVNKIINIISL